MMYILYWITSQQLTEWRNVTYRKVWIPYAENLRPAIRFLELECLIVLKKFGSQHIESPSNGSSSFWNIMEKFCGNLEKMNFKFGFEEKTYTEVWIMNSVLSTLNTKFSNIYIISSLPPAFLGDSWWAITTWWNTNRRNVFHGHIRAVRMSREKLCHYGNLHHVLRI